MKPLINNNCSLIKKLQEQNDEERRCNAELESYLKGAIDVNI